MKAMLVDTNWCFGCHACEIMTQVETGLGAYDGIEKTPEWASEICGCPVEKIQKFARIVGKGYNTSIHACGALARNTGAENFPQLLMTVGAMGGHFGKPGNACADDQQYGAFDHGPKLVARHEGKRIVTSFPALEAMGQARDNCLYIVKECMLDDDFDEMLI